MLICITNHWGLTAWPLVLGCTEVLKYDWWLKHNYNLDTTSIKNFSYRTWLTSNYKGTLLTMGPHHELSVPIHPHPQFQYEKLEDTVLRLGCLYLDSHPCPLLSARDIRSFLPIASFYSLIKVQQKWTKAIPPCFHSVPVPPNRTMSISKSLTFRWRTATWWTRSNTTSLMHRNLEHTHESRLPSTHDSLPFVYWLRHLYLFSWKLQTEKLQCDYYYSTRPPNNCQATPRANAKAFNVKWKVIGIKPMKRFLMIPRRVIVSHSSVLMTWGAAWDLNGPKRGKGGPKAVVP